MKTIAERFLKQAKENLNKWSHMGAFSPSQGHDNNVRASVWFEVVTLMEDLVKKDNNEKH